MWAGSTRIPDVPVAIALARSMPPTLEISPTSSFIRATGASSTVPVKPPSGVT